MNKKIFITRQIPIICKQNLEKEGFVVDVYEKDEQIQKDYLVEVLQKNQYDGLISLLTDDIDSGVLSASDDLKIVSNYATGFNNIDLSFAKEKNICITNAPAPLTEEAVAEYTITAILTFSRRFFEADKYIRELKYKGWSPNNFVGRSLKGQIIGLVGTGKIGSMTAKYAHFFGMKIYYYDLVRNLDIENKFEAKYFDNLQEMLKEVDVVSLHLPLNSKTHHLISSDTFNLMKKDAFIINTARGAIINEKDLVNALKEEKIKGAVLDVFEFEPNFSEELLKMPNVILTPHIASANAETRNQMAEIASKNIIDFFRGNQVNNLAI